MEPHGVESESEDRTRGTGRHARETAGRMAGRAREQAGRVVGDRKDKAAHDLEALSDALRDGAGRLRGEQSVFSDCAESAAQRIEQLARYLRESDPRRLLEDTEDFARRRPEVFVGALFVTGLLLARFLKSSAEHQAASGVGAARHRSGRRVPEAPLELGI